MLEKTTIDMSFRAVQKSTCKIHVPDPTSVGLTESLTTLLLTSSVRPQLGQAAPTTRRDHSCSPPALARLLLPLGERAVRLLLGVPHEQEVGAFVAHLD